MAFEFKLPDIGEGVVEGEIVTWLIRPGDAVEEDQPIVEVMTDKATVEIPSPVGGKILECRGAEGDIVAVGSVLVVIDAETETTSAQPSPTSVAPAPPESGFDVPAEEMSAPTPSKHREGIKATPAVRKLAREAGVDLLQVEGSGRGGRITRRDIETAAKTVPQTPKASPDAGLPPASGDVETIPYRGLRRRIGNKLSLSKNSAAHFTYVEEVDVTELVALRQRFYQEAEQKRRLTYLPFIIKAVVSGLKKYPLLNAALDEVQGEIQLRKYYNIGVATATEEGLIVPVVKRADQKGVMQIADEIYTLTEAARTGEISLQDLQDSTFTITSLGVLGGVLATPIINFPEVAILGVHKIRPRPVVREGAIAIREIMNLTLSLDHRVVDGSVGAKFMHYIIPLIEEPGLLLLESE